MRQKEGRKEIMMLVNSCTRDLDNIRMSFSGKSGTEESRQKEGGEGEDQGIFF